MKKLLLILSLFIPLFVSAQLYTGVSNVQMPQIPDPNNTAFRDITDGITEFVGYWSPTVSRGVVRILTVLASAPNDSLGGTFVFEFSNDTLSAPPISESRTINSFETVRDFDLINAGAYFRVRFTPSRIMLPGEFVAINTTLRTQNDGTFVRLGNQEIEEANAAMPQTFAYLKGFHPVTKKSVGLRIDPSGALVVGSQELQIASKNTDAYSKHTINARNPDLDSGIKRVIWGGSPTVYTGQPTGVSTLAVAQPIRISSNFATDIFPSGTGARRARVYGLNQFGLEQVDTLNLNGIVGVVSTTLWYRIFEVRVVSAGVSAGNDGILTTTHSITTTNVFSVIPPGQNESSIGTYTIPANKTGYIENLYAQMGGAGTTGEVRFFLEIRDFGGVFTPKIDVELTQATILNPPINFGIILPALADLKLSGTADTNNQNLYGRVNLILEKN